MLKINILSLLLIMCIQGLAQKKPSKQKYLGVGDKVPDIEFPNTINYSSSRIKMSDFSGKTVILDFWAPWCSPCIAAFPKLDSLQKKFKGKLQILLVTKENRQFSEKLLTNVKKIKGISLFPSVVEDSVISKLFYHHLLPHYVWIDTKGIVQAITGAEEVTEENIEKMTEGVSLSLKLKDDNTTRFDDKRPIFSQSPSLFENELIFNSGLTKYIQGFPTMTTVKKGWLRCTSHSILLLYKVAFGKPILKGGNGFAFLNNNRVILEGFTTMQDSLEIGRNTSATKPVWNEIKHDHLYNYELIVRDSNFKQSQLYDIMQDDLNKFFAPKGLSGKREKRMVKTLELVRTTGEDKLKTLGSKPKDEHSGYYLLIQNQLFSSFVEKLQAFFTKEGMRPIINKVNYEGKVDIEINCDLTDITALNKQLEKYDLTLIEKEGEMDMIIITKKQKKQEMARKDNSVKTQQ